MKRLLATLLAMCMLLSVPFARAEEDGPLTPYADTVVVQMMMSDDPNVPFFNGETQDENVVEKFFRDYLNIDFQAKWLIDSTKYSEQLNLAINANTLPDMFVASKGQVANMAEFGQIADLTDVYERYISDSAREVLEFQNGVAFQPVTINGRIWALPLPNDFSDEITVMYIRKDWMEALNLEAPKTLADLVDMAIAFATQDPDGNGVDDTFGIATDAGLNYIAELIGHPLGAYRGIWMSKEDGVLEYANIKDEYKEMLRIVNRLYHAGGIDKEFAVKDINSMANDIAQGKCGIYPGSFWAIYWMLNMSMGNQIEAEWQAYPIIARADGSYQPRALDTTYRFLVVRNGYEHPEAAVKALNLWQEMWQGQYAAEYRALYSKDSGYDADVKYYSPIFFDPPYKNVEKAAAVKQAIETGDASGLNEEQLVMYSNYRKALENGNRQAAWQAETDIAVFHILKDAYQLNFRYSDFNGPTTAVMSELWPMVNQVTDVATHEIIMGEPDQVDARFDQYVADWYAAGGNELTQEVTAWYAENVK